MKIAPASFEILYRLDQESLAVRIEKCGRICYKSEDHITPESALPFVAKMAEHGHNSVLEMGVVTLEFTFADEETVKAKTDSLFLCQPKYLHISRETGRLLITGSVRSWREMWLKHPLCVVVRVACSLLREQYPYFFDSIMSGYGLIIPSISVRKVPLDEVERLPPDMLTLHRHVAVRFVVNRAVTHELVRHRACSFLQESQRYCRYSADKFGSEVTFIKPLFWAEESAEYAVWRQAMEETERLYFKLLETSTPQAARTVLPNSCKTEIIVYANLEQWRHIFKLRCSKAAEPSMREVMVPLREEFAKRWPEVFGDV